MEHEAEKIDGITLEMQDGENDVSKTTNKLEAALTKGADAPRRLNGRRRQ